MKAWLSVLVFAAIFSETWRVCESTCVLESDFGLIINCAFKKSSLFRIRNLGGIKAHISWGISIGDELGFKESISNVEINKRRSATGSKLEAQIAQAQQEAQRKKALNVTIPPVDIDNATSSSPLSTELSSSQNLTQRTRRKQSEALKTIQSPLNGTSNDISVLTLSTELSPPSETITQRPGGKQSATLQYIQPPLNGTSNATFAPTLSTKLSPPAQTVTQRPRQKQSAALVSTLSPPHESANEIRGTPPPPSFFQSIIRALSYQSTPKPLNRDPNKLRANSTTSSLDLVPSITETTSNSLQGNSNETISTKQPRRRRPSRKPSTRKSTSVSKILIAPKEYYPYGYSRIDEHYVSRVELPKTTFQCREQKHFPGLYADEDLGCMVFHVCVLVNAGDIISKSFLCPESTLFDQTILKCNWWFYVDCKKSKEHYDVNIPVSRSYQLMRALSAINGNRTVTDTPTTSSKDGV